MRKFGRKKQRVSDAELRQKISAELPSNADEVQALAQPRKLTVDEVQFCGALAVIACAKQAGTFHEHEIDREEKPKPRFRLNRKLARKRLEKLARKLSSRTKPEHQWE